MFFGCIHFVFKLLMKLAIDFFIDQHYKPTIASVQITIIIGKKVCNNEDQGCTMAKNIVVLNFGYYAMMLYNHQFHFRWLFSCVSKLFPHGSIGYNDLVLKSFFKDLTNSACLM